MQKRSESILRAISNKNGINILTFPTHERYSSNLGALDGVTFYMWQGKGIKNWNNIYAELPKNHILLNGSEGQILPDMKFDIVLGQGKHQYNYAKQFAQQLNCPLINLEHTLPYYQWPDKQIKAMKEMRGDIDVFISEYNTSKWQFDKNDPKVRILHHGIANLSRWRYA
jgi:hypothetical protein